MQPVKISILKNLFFSTMEEFTRFNHDLGDREIQVGLTLRSAKITHLVADHLKCTNPN